MEEEKRGGGRGSVVIDYATRKPKTVTIESCTTQTGLMAFTLYDIRVQWDDARSWTVSRRFSEFDDLVDQVKPFVSKIPSLPAKKWTFNLDPEFVAARKVELSKFLTELVEIEPVLTLKPVSDFLKLKENGIVLEPFDGQKLSLVNQFRDPQFGFNDISIDERLGVAVSVEEEANLASKVDSFMVNFKMPWDKSSPEVPLGCCVIWTRGSDEKWSASNVRNYDCPASCMAWDKINRRVFVGLQTGLIKQYQTDSDYNKISVLDDIRVHTGRVSALFYDSRRNFLVIVLLILFSYEKLSVSRDETIVLYSVDSRRELSSLKPMISSLMSLAIDVELQRGFIGSSSGKILIVDFSKTTIRFLYAIDAHASVVRSLYFERTNGYLFTGTFEQICSIWKVGNPGEESVSTKKVGVLRGGPSFNIKSVLFIPSRKAVVTGHESGYLAFWHTRDGNLINVVKVHDQAIVGLSWEDSSAELMTISRDGSVSIWSLTGREVSFRPHVKDDMYARIMKS